MIESLHRMPSRVSAVLQIGARMAVILAVFALQGCSQGHQVKPELRRFPAPIALHGTVVSTNGASDGWVVIQDNVIVSVTEGRPPLPRGATVIEHDGYIYPGLIDTHNHPHWNSIRAWRPSFPDGERYPNRYAWQRDPMYLSQVNAAYARLNELDLISESLKYGEVRAVFGGATAVQGSKSPPESRVLIRNLHTDYGADASADNIASPGAALLDTIESFQAGEIDTLFLHIAEGRRDDPVTQAEFGLLDALGLVREGVVIIHGIALTEPEFQQMVDHDMGLVWSPRSNIELYGETADVLTALNVGVVVALAPDWSITGSSNILDEMRCAADYSGRFLGGALTAADLFAMVTVNAAAIANFDGFAGEIKPGFVADLLLTPRLHENPFKSLLETHPKDIELVLVDGAPVYGDPSLVERFVERSAIEQVSVEGRDKAIVVGGDLRIAPEADQRLGDIVKALESALGATFAPLIEPFQP